MALTAMEVPRPRGDAEAGDEDADRAFNQAEIDYQLARALDLIRGVAIFGRIKPAS